MITGAVTIGNAAGNGEFSVVRCRLQINGGGGFVPVGPEMYTESLGDSNQDEAYNIALVAAHGPAGGHLRRADPLLRFPSLCRQRAACQGGGNQRGRHPSVARTTDTSARNQERWISAACYTARPVGTGCSTRTISAGRQTSLDHYRGGDLALFVPGDGPSDHLDQIRCEQGMESCVVYPERIALDNLDAGEAGPLHFLDEGTLRHGAGHSAGPGCGMSEYLGRQILLVDGEVGYAESSGRTENSGALRESTGLSGRQIDDAVGDDVVHAVVG